MNLDKKETKIPAAWIVFELLDQDLRRAALEDCCELETLSLCPLLLFHIHSEG